MRHDYQRRESFSHSGLVYYISFFAVVGFSIGLKCGGSDASTLQGERMLFSCRAGLAVDPAYSISQESGRWIDGSLFATTYRIVFKGDKVGSDYKEIDIPYSVITKRDPSLEKGKDSLYEYLTLECKDSRCERFRFALSDKTKPRSASNGL